MQKLFGVISPEPASCGEEQAIIFDFKCKRVFLENPNWLVFPLNLVTQKMEFFECEGKGRIVEEREVEEGEKVFIDLGLDLSLRLKKNH